MLNKKLLPEDIWVRKISMSRHLVCWRCYGRSTECSLRKHRECLLCNFHMDARCKSAFLQLLSMTPHAYIHDDYEEAKETASVWSDCVLNVNWWRTDAPQQRRELLLLNQVVKHPTFRIRGHFMGTKYSVMSAGKYYTVGSIALHCADSFDFFHWTSALQLTLPCLHPVTQGDVSISCLWSPFIFLQQVFT